MLIAMFNKMFNWQPPPTVLHPEYGAITHDDTCWQFEMIVDEMSVTILIEGDKTQAPIDEQYKFLESFTRNPDSAFLEARELLVSRFEEWTEKTFPNDWREVFTLACISVPLEGDPFNEWSLGFECIADPGLHLFTCYFEDGKPSYVSIDG